MQMTQAIRLVSGGDVMFEDRLAALQPPASVGVKEALAHLGRADICFINCEMPLTRSGSRVEKTFNLRSDPEIGHDLAALGVHVVSLANNHMLDYGYDGLRETLQTVDSLGIARVGAGLTLDEALRPHIRSVSGKRFAFLGVAATLPPGFAAGVDRPGVAPIRVSFSFEVDTNLMAEQPGTAPLVRTCAVQADVDRVTAAIAGARREADHVVVAVHWGTTRRRVTPYQGMIAEYQGPLGRAFIDAGADIVLGNHSHNLHGVEVYRGRPIFYSLGNFIFQRPHDYMEPESVIVVTEFADDSLRVRLVPVLVNAEGFPQIPEASERDRIAMLIGSLSEQFGTRFAVGEEGIDVILG